MTLNFAAKVKGFSDLSKAKMEAVVKESAQEVFAIASQSKPQGGRLPVDTGFLRNSFVAGLNGSTGLTGPDAYVAAIAGMELGDSVFGGWTAAYARRMEYGFVGTDSLGRAYNQTGNFFVLNAVQQWQAIVAANVQRAKAI